MIIRHSRKRDQENTDSLVGLYRKSDFQIPTEERVGSVAEELAASVQDKSKPAISLDKWVIRHRGKKEPLTTPISLEIFDGDNVYIYGANGVGKTSFLKSLVHQDSLSGSCRVTSVQKPMLFESREKIAYEKQSLGHFLRALPYKDLHSRIKDWGLEGHVHTSISALSRGERAKVSLLMADLLNPKVLLLDEPSLGLDGTGIALLKRLLKKRSLDHGVTIIATHELALLDDADDRIFVMSRQTLSVLREQTTPVISAEIKSSNAVMNYTGSMFHLLAKVSKLVALEMEGNNL